MKEINNAEEFDEVLRNNKIVVVDFWATWCKPCVTVGAMLEQFEQQYNHNIKFIKVNTDENLEIARRYNVLSLPTVIIFRNGEPEKRIVGSKSRYDFEDAIEEVIGWW